ncbi:leucyl aminopeptidase family protein [Asticcacaulis endophyticus]|uniref:Leucyl aminopeptidase n=1 Tax=Asticcacaulis endophyticus TaxID=1395890 RepID=A0A918PRC5_9CAUL|nr:leucyl aminopeptidase family protein [Asticcacaulis endophyticus]GGZ20525.1 leucyl aminopeptidase [Asticcacaulis endophyticus]
MAKPLKSTSNASGKSAPDHQIIAVFEDELAARLSEASPATRAYASARAFTARAGTLILLPEGKGVTAWYGLGARKAYNPMLFRALPPQLPKGNWVLKADAGLDRCAIHAAWGMGVYGFDRYKGEGGKNQRGEVKLDTADLTPAQIEAVGHEVAAHNLARDLINTPAQDMGPAELEAAARAVADEFGAAITVITGDELLAQNYPAIHAVGRAAPSSRAPRFIEITWSPIGSDGLPLPTVALVGKGITFDTGGLNMKGGAGMALMKKDMGGAAHVLALGRWIMATNLPVKLSILLCVAENSIGGEAFRPGDVLSSRAGLTIEVGNTDAEGRLVLADGLARASEINPDLTLDFATLTGAARIALGPEVVPFYCDDEEIVRRLEIASLSEHDPLWRMPLWAGYKDALESEIADIRNDPQGWAQAGSVTAALFLQRFAPTTGVWAHFDIYGWNPRGVPGYPTGAAAHTLRAVYRLIKGL